MQKFEVFTICGVYHTWGFFMFGIKKTWKITSKIIIHVYLTISISFNANNLFNTNNNLLVFI